MDVYTVSLAEADQALGHNLSADPYPMLAAVMGILTLSEDSPMLVDTDREDVLEAITFLAERLATTFALTEGP